MTKFANELTGRKLSAEESASMKDPSRKQTNINWLKRQFIDPETQQPIQVGEGIEVGPFDSEAEGDNWLSTILTAVTRDLQWGMNGGKTRGRSVTFEPRLRDDKVFMWIKRIK